MSSLELSNRSTCTASTFAMTPVNRMHLPLPHLSDPVRVSRFEGDSDTKCQDEFAYRARVFYLLKFALDGKFFKCQRTNDIRAAISPRHPPDWPNSLARCKCLRTFGNVRANRDR